MAYIKKGDNWLEFGGVSEFNFRKREGLVEDNLITIMDSIASKDIISGLAQDILQSIENILDKVEVGEIEKYKTYLGEFHVSAMGLNGVGWMYGISLGDYFANSKMFINPVARHFRELFPREYLSSSESDNLFCNESTIYYTEFGCQTIYAKRIVADDKNTLV